jgi:peptidyl-tRNA hydrolase
MSSVTEQLIAMGIDADLAAAAAAETGDVSCELAMALLFEDEVGGGGKVNCSAPIAALGPHKMVIAVNAALHMSSGKIAAQCCHASLAAYKETLCRGTGAEAVWAGAGESTIVLQATNASELERLAQVAHENGIVACTVHDAGRTQVAAGSMTCCAFG